MFFLAIESERPAVRGRVNFDAPLSSGSQQAAGLTGRKIPCQQQIVAAVPQGRGEGDESAHALRDGLQHGSFERSHRGGQNHDGTEDTERGRSTDWRQELSRRLSEIKELRPLFLTPLRHRSPTKSSRQCNDRFHEVCRLATKIG